MRIRLDLHCDTPEKSIVPVSALELPTPLTATTSTVYTTPSISPVKDVLSDVGDIVCSVTAPRFSVTSYLTTADPPLSDGMVHDTAIESDDVAISCTLLGGLGAAAVKRWREVKCI